MKLNLANSISALYDSLVGKTVAEKALELRLNVSTDFSEPFYFFLFWAPDASHSKEVFFYECLDVLQPVIYEPISTYDKCGEAVENHIAKWKSLIKEIEIDGVRVINLTHNDFVGGYDLSRGAKYEKTKEGKMVLVSTFA